MKTVIVDFRNQIKNYENSEDNEGLADVIIYILSMTLAAREVGPDGKLNLGPYHVMWAAAMNIIPALNEMEQSIAEIIEEPEENFNEFAELVRSKLTYPAFSNEELIQAIRIAVELNKLIMKDTE